jgi:hypothetical protein
MPEDIQQERQDGPNISEDAIEDLAAGEEDEQSVRGGMRGVFGDNIKGESTEKDHKDWLQ